MHISFHKLSKLFMLHFDWFQSLKSKFLHGIFFLKLNIFAKPFRSNSLAGFWMISNTLKNKRLFWSIRGASEQHRDADRNLERVTNRPKLERIQRSQFCIGMFLSHFLFYVFVPVFVFLGQVTFFNITQLALPSCLTLLASTKDWL